MSAPSIYRHFEDKDALIAEVCIRAFGELDRRLGDRMGDEPDPVERLRLAAEAYVEFGLARPSFYRALFLDKSFGAAPVGTLAELIVLPNGFPRLLAECERAIAAGVVASDPLLLALHLWAVVHGIVSLRIVMDLEDWPSVEQQLALFVAQLRGSSAPQPTPRRRSPSAKGPTGRR